MLQGLGGNFVLLDDGVGARLYRNPVSVIRADDHHGIGPALAALDDALAQGLHVVGYMGYEAGLALEPRVTRLARRPDVDTPPMLWFGLFEDCETVPADAMHGLQSGADIEVGAPLPCISRDDYAAAFARAQQLIQAGDIYQVNLTFPCRVPLRGHPLDLYARLRTRAGARHGGVVHVDGHWILSFSPELFFTVEDGTLLCRPMKGTACRGPDPRRDALAAQWLASDPKQRAENLMIVDLLRNDMARISEAGTVSVPKLFEVETYPTIHQLTSTITATLKPDLSAGALLRALFPCGSITGAPKIRAMEVIAELETAQRGVYTGSIGAFAPDGAARFNVAIRTLCLPEGQDIAMLGVGSAIVADSDPEAEWRECLAKTAFLRLERD